MFGAEMYNMRRMMDDGIEDPATGSAACVLACWIMLQRGGANNQASFQFHQGAQTGRPSVLFVDVKLDEDGTCVKSLVLGGHAVQVMEGIISV